MHDPQQLLRRLDEDGIQRLFVVFHDYSGRACAKVVPRSSFASIARDGLVFALANLNMDSNDAQVSGATLFAESGDFMAVPDPRSYAVVPRFPKTARAHAWMRSAEGLPWDGCPRTRLERVVEELRGEGFSAQVALEPEFYLLRGDPESEGLQPVNRARMYSQAGLAIEQPWVYRMLDELDGMGVPVEVVTKEYQAGQYEMSARHRDPVGAIDDYFSIREAVRDVSREFGYIASFMPKIDRGWAGNSLHVHLSLWDADGTTDLTPSGADDVSLSDQGRWFMGGLLAHVEALTALGSPTVNSYKRLRPGSWAPANTYWGVGNRSAIVRIPGNGGRRHFEFRSPDNTAQPYLMVAGLLAAGLDGIRNRIDPGPPYEGDVKHLGPEEIAAAGLRFLPRTLPDALAALERDEVVAGAVGPEALRHFLAVKRGELETYETVVHEWERDSYLEVP